MKELVIGGSGFIGAALRDRLPPTAPWTSHRHGVAPVRLDLRDVSFVPEADIVYLCGGTNGARPCEGSQDAFRANVDGPIAVARLVAARGGFTVWISSMSVEWFGGGAYQRQKLATECVLRTLPAVGIVRAGRVTPANVGSLCDTLLRVGRGRIEGLTRWGTDDIAYVK